MHERRPDPLRELALTSGERLGEIVEVAPLDEPDEVVRVRTHLVRWLLVDRRRSPAIALDTALGTLSMYAATSRTP